MAAALTSYRETIAIRDPQSFFHLLDSFTVPETPPLSQYKNAQNAYQKFIAYAQSLNYLSEPGELASFEMTLALHSSVPRIEAAYEYFLGHHASRNSECGSWVDWYGQVVCDVETLQRLADIETIEVSANITRDKCVPLYFSCALQ